MTKAAAQVTLLAEGTYPYVRGGVSAWMHDLVTGLPDTAFAIIFLGSRKQDYSGLKYKMPANVVHFEEHYLFDDSERPRRELLDGTKKAYALVTGIHEVFRKAKNMRIPDEVKKLDFYIKDVTFAQFLFSRSAWKFISGQYEAHCPKIPFIDYFWTLRNIHAPIWVVAGIARRIQGLGSVLHSPSTGYAGLLGALIHYHTGKPLILTEHGIYTREREIDILKAQWIQDNRTFLEKTSGEANYLRQVWIRFFKTIGRLCYDASDEIISLFDHALEIQVVYGADRNKTRIIPNGIDFKRFSALKREHKDGPPRIIGLVGRVVSIKDIKTFIKAIKIVSAHIPDVQGWVIGPQEQDPEYTRECLMLTESLGLQENIKFTGYRKVDEVLPEMGLTTLTSVSEGMPLSIIEAFAAGVPAVMTDVGAAHQLIYGAIDAADKAIGAAGEVVGISDPQALSRAYIKLLTDRGHWEACRAAASKRAAAYYTREEFLQSYADIYGRALKKWRA
ncbi:MAG TPA: glycosyl transferase family 1 [Elusimicrobia bacterium]|nr:glycosyl transferase family 1 [Elusimicrobiota bacterium]